MKCDEFYSINTTPLVTRETFNNTIILLTMIRRDCYYITGFSRPDHIIKIAFDFQSDLHKSITEELIVDFLSNKDYIVIKSILKNISAKELYPGIELIRQGTFSCNNNEVIYEYKIEKDKVLPIGFDAMHKSIVRAKREIVVFEEECFRKYLSNPAE